MFTDTMTLGEQLMSALGVTLLGMGIVFAVLIGLSFALDLLRVIAGEKPKKETTPSKDLTKKNEENLERVETVVENVQDEEELVAVIAAAICAASGRRMEDLLVKSIKPIPQKTSIWSAAGRQQQMLERF